MLTATPGMSMALQVEAVPLEYASALQPLGREHRRAFGLMLWLAVLSGPCVGTCLLVLSNPLIFATLHVLVFAVTIFSAVRAQTALQAVILPHDAARFMRARLLDFAVLLSLAIIGLAAVPLALVPDARSNSPRTGAAICIVALAYAVLSIGSVRHIRVYRTLANLCRVAGRRGSAAHLIALGYVKAIFECLWLACCALTLCGIAASRIPSATIPPFTLFAAYGALLGLLGFTGVWIWMVVAHALLFRLANRQPSRRSPA
jgi:hypothetical protein